MRRLQDREPVPACRLHAFVPEESPQAPVGKGHTLPFASLEELEEKERMARVRRLLLEYAGKIGW